MAEIQKYQQQLERVKRFYKRFKQIDEGIITERPTSYLEDEVWAFFIFCYHLKDWIKNDDTLSSNIKDKVEELINENECLGICGDLCNGIKHLILTKSRSEKYGKIGRKKVFAELAGGNSLKVRIEFEIPTLIKTHDAFELATECLEAWERFFNQNI